MTPRSKKERALDMWARRSSTEIADVLDVPISTVNGWVYIARLKGDPRAVLKRATHEQRSLARAAVRIGLDSGMSMRAIAKQRGISRQAVYAMKKRMGLT